MAENSQSAELRALASESLRKIDPRAINTPAAALFFQLAEKHYYHNESLNPPADVPIANIWFWDSNANRLARIEVAREYFHELMCMRCCEWSLKAQEQFGVAIGLWLAAFFKAESAGVPMPEYFGQDMPTPWCMRQRRARSTCTRLWPVRSMTGIRPWRWAPSRLWRPPPARDR